ncbi:hypothetical protein [Gordonia sp. N1V]|uniref:hypothetical protein n=1 Tax=Gordonia sp. N1V TaxID=3034163 RepID=UPI0023E196D3|nr:hypothetical protein [Gordonia sp. N1V]MDF3280861.1 hypothetical protein [Gordonia sp. N1V]
MMWLVFRHPIVTASILLGAALILMVLGHPNAAIGIAFVECLLAATYATYY